jgi:hypothetical protein
MDARVCSCDRWNRECRDHPLVERWTVVLLPRAECAGCRLSRSAGHRLRPCISASSRQALCFFRRTPIVYVCARGPLSLIACAPLGSDSLEKASSRQGLGSRSLMSLHIALFPIALIIPKKPLPSIDTICSLAHSNRLISWVRATGKRDQSRNVGYTTVCPCCQRSLSEDNT